MEYMEAKMQDFYDGWDARVEACVAKSCGCPEGVCDVESARNGGREVFTVDLDEDLPFSAPVAKRPGR